MFSRFCVITVKATEKPALPQPLCIGLLLRAGRPAGARAQPAPAPLRGAALRKAQMACRPSLQPVAFQHSLSTGRMGGVPASANPSTRIPRLSAKISPNCESGSGLWPCPTSMV